jgi:uncharacterized membrane protein YphA (DoxX/SURF4 family)
MLGLFFLSQGSNKLAWLLDSGILGERLHTWMRGAAPGVRWYIETIAVPGVPIFARLVPVAELSTGLALLVGFWPRLAAGLAFVMVLNFHFALGNFFAPREFLLDGAGLPVLGGLLAIAIGGARLPWSVRP